MDLWTDDLDLWTLHYEWPWDDERNVDQVTLLMTHHNEWWHDQDDNFDHGMMGAVTYLDILTNDQIFIWKPFEAIKI